MPLTPGVWLNLPTRDEPISTPSNWTPTTAQRSPPGDTRANPATAGSFRCNLRVAHFYAALFNIEKSPCPSGSSAMLHNFFFVISTSANQ
jgi:hypothetical protein